MLATFGFPLDWDISAKEDLDYDSFHDKLLEMVKEHYDQREKELGTKPLRELERIVLMQLVDTHWKEHLLNMDHLKEGIGLRGYGQKNPLDEYKKEGFNMFREMISTVKVQTVSTLFRIKLVSDDEVSELGREQRQQEQEMQLSGPETGDKGQRKPAQANKVGRNAPCPCGSGKKYKRCCGSKR
jgi:preprotein translocase subunit SecA